MNRRRKKSASFLGSIAGAVLKLFGKLRAKPGAAPPDKDFKSSTQRIGLHFPDRLRDIFRNRWIK